MQLLLRTEQISECTGASGTAGGNGVDEMNGSDMKRPISKGSLLLGAALFVIGTAAGGLVLYGYQIHERSALVHASAPEPPQQPPPKAAAPMADMPGLPGSGAQQPKPPEPAPTAGMPGMGAPESTAQEGQAAPATSAQNTVPGTVMLNPASQQLIGVRYTEARRTDMKRTLRTV